MKKWLVLAIFAGLLTVALQIFFTSKDTELGVTFSDQYAEYLGVNSKELFLAVLDDLKVKKIRIPIYWSDIERNEGERDYSQIDWMMSEAEKRDVDITLVIGIKVPRWPECYIPDWAENKNQKAFNESLLSFIGNTVNRYKDYPALYRWQVENEAFFPFGVCPSSNLIRVQDELNLVRKLDRNHEVQMTVSGEQSIWSLTAQDADVLGFSLYQRAWNPVVGFMFLPVPPSFYKFQLKIARLFTKKVIVSELQAEPWAPDDWDFKDKNKIEKMYKLFTVSDMQSQVRLAKSTGAKEIYLWGVEWWYYIKQQGDVRLWLEAKNIFKNN